MAIISCPECGRQVSDKALKCPQCAHPIANPETREQLLPPKPLQKEPESTKQKWLKLIGAAILVVIALNVGKDIFDQLTSQGRRSKEITKDIDKVYDKYLKTLSTPYLLSDYNQITTGMSYSQVTSILGGKSKELSRVDIKGAPLTISYQWQNDDGSNIIVVFQDDAVTTKAQALLK